MTHVTARFFCPRAKVSLPVRQHLKVSISADIHKTFNVFNTSVATMLKVLIYLHKRIFFLTFHCAARGSLPMRSQPHLHF